MASGAVDSRPADTTRKPSTDSFDEELDTFIKNEDQQNQKHQVLYLTFSNLGIINDCGKQTCNTQKPKVPCL